MLTQRSRNILASPPEPPAYLAEKVLRSIAREERRRIVRQMIASGIFLAASLGAAGVSTMSFGNDLAHSGFLSFVSLFGTDFSFVAANMRDVAFSLAESFPALSASLCLASVGFALWFAARLARGAASVRENNFAKPSFS